MYFHLIVPILFYVLLTCSSAEAKRTTHFSQVASYCSLADAANPTGIFTTQGYLQGIVVVKYPNFGTANQPSTQTVTLNGKLTYYEYPSKTQKSDEFSGTQVLAVGAENHMGVTSTSAAYGCHGVVYFSGTLSVLEDRGAILASAVLTSSDSAYVIAQSMTLEKTVQNNILRFIQLPLAINGGRPF